MPVSDFKITILWLQNENNKTETFLRCTWAQCDPDVWPVPSPWPATPRAPWRRLLPPTLPHPAPGLRLKAQHADPACPNRPVDWYLNNDSTFVPPLRSELSICCTCPTLKFAGFIFVPPMRSPPSLLSPTHLPLKHRGHAEILLTSSQHQPTHGIHLVPLPLCLIKWGWPYGLLFFISTTFMCFVLAEDAHHVPNHRVYIYCWNTKNIKTLLSLIRIEKDCWTECFWHYICSQSSWHAWCFKPPQHLLRRNVGKKSESFLFSKLFQ